MDITIAHFTVDDFIDTSLWTAFERFPGDTVVVQAGDRESGIVCALAQAEGQPLADLEREARFQLALHISKSAVAAGDASDPRA